MINLDKLGCKAQVFLMWFILYFLLLIKAFKRVPMPIYINSRIVNSQNHGVDMISDALLSILIIASIASPVLAEDSSNTISVEHYVNPSVIDIKGSEYPDNSNIMLKIIGKGSIPERIVDAVLVMDVSNSMSEPNLFEAKMATKSFIGMMNNSRDKIGFVSFNSTLGPSLNPQANFSEINATIDSIMINGSNILGSTCLSVGLNEAIKMLNNQNDSAEKIIVYFSDGNNKTCTKYDDACVSAIEANKRKIIIYAIGLNDSGIGSDNLKCMTRISGGNYFSTSNSLKFNDVLKKVSNNIHNIIAYNVIINYKYSNGIIIGNVEPNNLSINYKEPNFISIALGAISANETKVVSFNVRANKTGLFYLAIGNKSSVSFNGKDSFIEAVPIDQKEISVINYNISNSIIKSINFQAETSEVFRNDLYTNMSITKSIVNGPYGPRIILKFSAPPPERIKNNIVIAIDSSGSLGNGGVKEYEYNIRESMPKILETINASMPQSNISILSWDDDIDFSYSPLRKKPKEIAELVPISQAKRDIIGNNIFKYSKSNQNLTIIDYLLSRMNKDYPNDYYYSIENETTNFNVGLERSKLILDKAKNKKTEASRNLIFLIVGRSEFIPCNKELIDSLENDHINVHTVGISVIEGSMMHKELLTISKNKSNYHYSPGSWLFNDASMASAISIALKQINKDNITDSIYISDTFYPYFNIHKESIQSFKNDKIMGNENVSKSIIENADGTSTINIKFDKNNITMKPGDELKVTIDTSLKFSIPIDFEKMFLINQKPEKSFISYRWLDNSQICSIPLAEGKIKIN
jgi:hypothetical protein